MALESANYIPELDAVNPPGTDDVSQGDDHLRAIKRSILGTFPNFVGTTGTPKTVSLTEDELSDAVQKAANQTISGDNTYSGTSTFSGDLNAADVTADSYDGILATNLLDETAAIDDTVVNSDAAQPGYKGAPQRIVNTSDNLVLTDAGKQIYKASGGAGETITIPANASVAFPIGTIIEFINDGGGDLDIAITTDTLEKFGDVAGTQTLTDNNKAIIEKVTATLWKYSSTD